MPTPRHASHAAIDPVETVTPPSIGHLQAAGVRAGPTGSCCFAYSTSIPIRGRRIGQVYSRSLRLRGRPCYSWLVQLEEFVYPTYGAPLVDAYGGRFESTFVVLHPFVRVPVSLSWSATRQYPSDAQIAEFGSRCTWSDISAQVGITSCARMNQALLTSIGSLADPMADPAGGHRLQRFLESNPVWMPVEGRFEPLLQRSFLQILAASGADELAFVPEFPQSHPVVRLTVEGLLGGTIPFPTCGTIFPPDASFLFTVDWDSFFTLFYGPRAFIRDAVQRLKLEGFFATANTDHDWWNYSMGCATVTVSPEDWQTA